MGDLPQFKEDLGRKITTWQRGVALKLMKTVWGAHVRDLEEDELSQKCVCQLPRACVSGSRPSATFERDLLNASEGQKDTAKDAELVEAQLPAFKKILCHHSTDFC